MIDLNLRVRRRKDGKWEILRGSRINKSWLRERRTGNQRTVDMIEISGRLRLLVTSLGYNYRNEWLS